MVDRMVVDEGYDEKQVHDFITERIAEIEYVVLESVLTQSRKINVAEGMSVFANHLKQKIVESSSESDIG